MSPSHLETQVVRGMGTECPLAPFVVSHGLVTITVRNGKREQGKVGTACDLALSNIILRKLINTRKVCKKYIVARQR